MKKRIFALCCAVMLVLCTSGCGWLTEWFGLELPTVTTDPPTDAPDESTTSVPASVLLPSSPSGVWAPSGTTDEAGITGTTDVTETTTEPGVVGYTSKGYAIKEEDGLTYVNGVLIVNKTYGVPEDYAPGDLTPECAAAFRQLQAAAAEVGLNIFPLSGYRSYETQTGLYARYCAKDGQAAADTYSARPGHSEHQTGLAIDVNSLSHTFADTPEGQWLAANAHLYGFIIRYQKDKQAITGYAYEPWHIRYLGRGMAQAVHESGLCLEEYFGITSAYDD